MGTGEGNKLRTWREEQVPRLTLDAAAAAVGTVRQVWYDWETGRRIPRAPFMAAIYQLTRGAVTPNDFYDLPPIGQLELPINTPSAPLLEGCSAPIAADAGDEAQPALQAAA